MSVVTCSSSHKQNVVAPWPGVDSREVLGLAAGVFITILTNVVMIDQGRMLDLGMRNAVGTAYMDVVDVTSQRMCVYRDSWGVQPAVKANAGASGGICR